MTRARRPVLLVGAVAASVLVLAGCTVNGGGWIPGEYAKKATFGFTWVGEDCEPGFGAGSTGVVDGGEAALVCDPTHAKGFWADGSVKFRIAEGGLEALGLFDGCWYGSGTYVPAGKNPIPGDVEIMLCDRGEPGASSEDEVEVELSGGSHGGYNNGGIIRGGNLQLTDHEDDLP